MEKDSAREAQRAAGKALAIFAFIFIIVVGIFGSLLLARSIPNFFGGAAAAITSIFTSEEPQNQDGNGNTSTAPQSIFVSASSDTVSDKQTFTLSWGHTGRTAQGAYTFRYDCASGISFTSPSASGAATAIACNTSLNLDNTMGSIALTALSTAPTDASAVLHIDFVPQGSSVASISGSVPVTVKKAQTTGTPSGGTTTTYPTTPVSDPNGYVDFSVRTVAVGIVNRSSGIFYTVPTPSRSSLADRIAIRFEVKNNGTKTSPQWYFKANLPTSQGYTFDSQAQNALRPGESIIFTLAFDGFVNSNSGSASVTVDPTNFIAESNKNNNYLIQTINTVP